VKQKTASPVKQISVDAQIPFWPFQREQPKTTPTQTPLKSKKTKRTCTTNKNKGPPCETGYHERLNNPRDSKIPRTLCCFKDSKASMSRLKYAQESNKDTSSTPGKLPTHIRWESSVSDGSTLTQAQTPSPKSQEVISKQTVSQDTPHPIKLKKTKRKCTTNRNKGPPCDTGYHERMNNPRDSSVPRTLCCFKDKATKPDAVKKATKPDAVKKATKPDAVKKATMPDAVKKVTKPDAVKKATKPDAVNKATKPDAVNKATKPDAVKKATMPDAVKKAKKAKKVTKPDAVKNNKKNKKSKAKKAEASKKAK
jgi:hypothetical protein